MVKLVNIPLSFVTFLVSGIIQQATPHAAFGFVGAIVIVTAVVGFGIVHHFNEQPENIILARARAVSVTMVLWPLAALGLYFVECSFGPQGLEFVSMGLLLPMILNGIVLMTQLKPEVELVDVEVDEETHKIAKIVLAAFGPAKGYTFEVPTAILEYLEIETSCVSDMEITLQNAEVARALGYLSNEDIFNHPLNKANPEAKDPRSAWQREFQATEIPPNMPALTQNVIKPLKLLPRELWVSGPILRIKDEMDKAGDAQKKPKSEARQKTNVEIHAIMTEHRLVPAAVPAHVLGTSLIAYSDKLPFILASINLKVERFFALGRLLGCPLIDRTGILKGPLKTKCLHPIPPFDPTFNKSLDTIMLRRAEELLEHRDTDLHVLWSGGIDTTAAVVAFIRVWKGTPKFNLIVIRYCVRSAEEYPKFFEEVIKTMRHQRIQGHVRDVYDGKQDVVTGDPADMLFGTFLMSQAFSGRMIGKKVNPLHNKLEAPWEVVIPELLHSRGLLIGRLEDLGIQRPNTTKKDVLAKFEHQMQARKTALLQEYTTERVLWLNWIRPFVARSPVPVVTVFDFLWWVTYACKYSHDLLRVLYNRPSVTPHLLSTVVNFFEPEDFHQWSFHNHHLKMQDKRVWASYKYPLKKFIFDFNQDAEYYSAKMKCQSVQCSWGTEVAIDDQFNVIRFGQYSISYQKMEQTYGTLLFDRFISDQLRLREAARQTRLTTDAHSFASNKRTGKKKATNAKEAKWREKHKRDAEKADMKKRSQTCRDTDGVGVYGGYYYGGMYYSGAGHHHQNAHDHGGGG